MVALVTLEEALVHLGYGAAADADEELAAAVEADAETASDLIVAYVREPDENWTDANLPARIKSAILVTLTNVWAARTDPANAPPPITETVDHLLYGLRDPALA